ncbi:semaphorin-5A-like isoform X2 [Saccostrea cucullata]|uniref:semaphorin-5A-like isoform X2 n=1 Tax=Saccostrea cuccullata TaxID=36930 RepID=UPI002ED16F70
MIAVWTTWSGFSQCSRTCGQGTQTRTRQMNCTGIVSTSSVCLDKQIESKDCNSIPCDKIPLNGGWSSWKEMVKCSKSCGGGMRIRYRTCSNPIPANGGQFCVGASVKTTLCNDQPCPAKTTQGSFVTLPRNLWVTLKRQHSTRIS